jgi:phosphatidylserine decarboxylase
MRVQVMIGASEVGSVVPLVKEGQTVKKVRHVAASAQWTVAMLSTP